LFVRANNDISNYHAATITLRKRQSHGLTFDMNYTFSKSLDQLGAVQNSASTYQTSFNPGLQYGPSLFGVFAGNFGGGSFAGSENKIPTVDPNSIAGGAHFGVTGTTFGTGGNVNIFSNPDAAAADFRFPLIGVDGRDGSGNPVRGLGLWNLDARLGKVTSFRERFKVEVSADFFNIFNHPNFFDPSFNALSPATFGVINTELIPANRTQGSRWIELGLPVSF